jgi:hypothetical protein
MAHDMIKELVSCRDSLLKSTGVVKVIDMSLTGNHVIANRFVSSYAFPVPERSYLGDVSF